VGYSTNAFTAHYIKIMLIYARVFVLRHHGFTTGYRSPQQLQPQPAGFHTSLIDVWPHRLQAADYTRLEINDLYHSL